MPAAGANTFLFGKLCSVLGIELNKVECASESDRLTNLPVASSTSVSWVWATLRSIPRPAS